MEEFTRKELNLISIYDPGTRYGMIVELEEMMSYLMPDELPLRLLAESVIRKLERISDYDYHQIADHVTFIPEEEEYAG
ncbi:MAG: transposon-transfer assisting family protein [Clostridia bacterium]|nr:transposon-transfer assisting family protein [Clostridia bacterium]